MTTMKVCVLLAFVAIAKCGRDSEVEWAFINSEIVPDVISEPPPNIMTVNYPSGVTASLGNELTPTLAKDEPTLSWINEADALYTFMLVDPDIPTRIASIAEAFHLLVINIPGDAVTKGQTVLDYVGPAPSLNTGLHRYICLVYQQTKFIELSEQPTARDTTTAQDYIDENGLVGPVAGHFFIAQYDDYVPIIQATKK